MLLGNNKFHYEILCSACHLSNAVVRRFSSKVTNSSKWKPVVGLEIHAQIKTDSKLFSAAGTNFTSAPNNSVALFDAAIPGTLPVLNRRCVEAGVLTALALSCELNPVSYFDRKHYFYADLPAGYQITQQRSPLARNGVLNFIVYTEGQSPRLYPKQSRIHQLQLEQDSGRSLHDSTRSLVDLNRAGMPLMELVFEPDLCDGEEAASLVKELIQVLKRLGVCSCVMEEGGLRVDANISVNREGEPLGVRTEVKNISSVRGIANAITYEIDRQIALCEQGQRIVNETRAWDMVAGRTVPMRDKEEKQDYRYMPEPNLPPLRLNMNSTPSQDPNIVNVGYLREQLPELPPQTRQRLQDDHGLTLKHSHIIVSKEMLSNLLTDTLKQKPDQNITILVKLLLNEVLTYYYKSNEQWHISSSSLNEIVDLLNKKSITHQQAKNIFEQLMQDDKKSPKQIVIENKWGVINDPAEINTICKAVLEDNPEIVKLHTSGKKDMTKALKKRVWLKYSGEIDMDLVADWFRTNLPPKKS